MNPNYDAMRRHRQRHRRGAPPVAATPAQMEAARVHAQVAGDTTARARLADYATALLARRLTVPAPVPYTTWMV